MTPLLTESRQSLQLSECCLERGCLAINQYPQPPLPKKKKRSTWIDPIGCRMKSWLTRIRLYINYIQQEIRKLSQDPNYNHSIRHEFIYLRDIVYAWKGALCQKCVHNFLRCRIKFIVTKRRMDAYVFTCQREEYDIIYGFGWLIEALNESIKQFSKRNPCIYIFSRHQESQVEQRSQLTLFRRNRRRRRRARQ